MPVRARMMSDTMDDFKEFEFIELHGHYNIKSKEGDRLGTITDDITLGDRYVLRANYETVWDERCLRPLVATIEELNQAKRVLPPKFRISCHIEHEKDLKKTKVWAIYKGHNDDFSKCIGHIRWYPAWRRYTLKLDVYPGYNQHIGQPYSTEFTEYQLKIICDFLEQAMKEHKEMK